MSRGLLRDPGLGDQPQIHLLHGGRSVGGSGGGGEWRAETARKPSFQLGGFRLRKRSLICTCFVLILPGVIRDFCSYRFSMKRRLVALAPAPAPPAPPAPLHFQRWKRLFHSGKYHVPLPSMSVSVPGFALSCKSKTAEAFCVVGRSQSLGFSHDTARPGSWA